MVVPSFCDKLAGLAGILGFSALFTGGGSDVLFVFLSVGLGLCRPLLAAGMEGVLGDG